MQGFERTSSAPPLSEDSKLNRNATPYAPKGYKKQQEGLSTIKEEETRKDAPKPELRATASMFIPKGNPKAASSNPPGSIIPASTHSAPSYSAQGILYIHFRT